MSLRNEECYLFSKGNELQLKKIKRITEVVVLENGPEELNKVYSKVFEKSIKDKQI